MYLLQQFKPKVRSGTRVDLKSVMGSSPPERTTSTSTMARIVKETSK